MAKTYNRIMKEAEFMYIHEPVDISVFIPNNSLLKCLRVFCQSQTTDEN